MRAYLEGSISEVVFFNYLDHFNEDIFDLLSSIKRKVLDVFFSILTNSVIIGLGILKKLSTIFSWILQKLKSFRQSNPVVYKILLITTLVFLILIISGSCLGAATTGGNVSKESINLAIGLINDMKDNFLLDNFTQLDITKATAYLIKLRDNGGVVNVSDLTVFGESTVELANKSLEVANKLKDDAAGDQSISKYCIDLLEKGSRFIGMEFQKFDGGESVKLLVK